MACVGYAELAGENKYKRSLLIGPGYPEPRHNEDAPNNYQPEHDAPDRTIATPNKWTLPRQGSKMGKGFGFWATQKGYIPMATLYTQNV